MEVEHVPSDTEQREFVTAGVDAVALANLAMRVLSLERGVLLVGAPGSGKSTLARRLSVELDRMQSSPVCIGADPGSPAFGVPGSVCLGRWQGDDWQLLALEGLCTLDAGRFRLPLAVAVQRLLSLHGAGPLLVDGPGVVRGVAGAELLHALIETTQVGAVISVQRELEQSHLRSELRSVDLPIWVVLAAGHSHRPGKRARARHRTELWDRYLTHASIHEIDLTVTPVLGTPPPIEARSQWIGRQVTWVCVKAGTGALGEIIDLNGNILRVRCHHAPQAHLSILVRDARRGSDALLGSATADASAAVNYVAPTDVLPASGTASRTGPRPVVRAGPVTAALVNGVFGDPLLHVRVHHHRRSILFDLGDGVRLPAKIAHQVTDVFLSHAHIDHIAGFLWLVRSRIGKLPAVHLFGPPGIAANVEGMLAGIHWDRVHHRGPRFVVSEYDGDFVRRMYIQAGGNARATPAQTVTEGILLKEPQLLVRAACLDHGTPVLAFALETGQTLKVRKDQLQQTGITPGPWLTRLKTLTALGERAVHIDLPNGRSVACGELADQVLLRAPGVKLVYATDLADTNSNRERLSALARSAHTFFCEASFRIADTVQAHRTGHLTTRACGEIAICADVQRLIPFHFSRRYEDDLAGVYDEVRAAFSRTMTPLLHDNGE